MTLKCLGVKIVWTVHNLTNHENRFPRLDLTCARIVSRLSHVLLVHGESAKVRVASAFGLHSTEKIVVIPHGNYVDAYANEVKRSEARFTLKLSDHALVFLFLGAVRPYKGVVELLEAYRSFEDRDQFLMVAGRPLNEAYAEKIWSLIGEKDPVSFFPGFIPDEEVQIYMNAADVVVLPYREILSSGAAILAMSFGKACIAPRRGCLEDVLDERGAFMYEADDTCGLKNALDEAMVNRDEVSAMGAYNREKADLWNWNSVGSMVCDLYRSL